MATIRHAQSADYGRVIQHLNAWWGGRQMSPALPQLFFVHFEGSSFVAEDDEQRLRGFLCGFLSQTRSDEAFVHSIGVDPAYRGSGLGRALYEAFFDNACTHGRRIVRCVVYPGDEAALAFHRSLGFVEDRTVADYDGPGEDRILLERTLGPA